jgi:predicted Co/Zn/Cd cation transporter (cation efflux family)
VAPPDPTGERRALGLSIAVATIIGVVGIVVGLLAGSQLIVLDGAYAFIGVAVSWLLLLVSRLVGIGPTHRYPYGRDALTPLVVGVQGFVLLGTVLYAAIEAVSSLLDGGSTVAVGWALVYAIGTTIVSFVVWRRLHQAAVGSDLVGAEATAWRVSTYLGAGMILGFVILAIAVRMDWDGVAPYVDPVMVLATSAVLLPAPVAMVRTTFVELLEGAPPTAVQAPVLDAITETHERFGLGPPIVRMTKLGSRLYVEVDGEADGETTIEREHAVRRHLEAELDALPFDVWLNYELFPGGGIDDEDAATR